MPPTSLTAIEKAARLKLMVFDVDGVMTDGSLWFNESGEVLKRFNVLAFVLLLSRVVAVLRLGTAQLN
jgi:3-deoxy-D-manno-octulosonate 8-phosphate phosphatase KdsC-like HAD superfamily phosphatase